jgi:hypothetical protein
MDLQRQLDTLRAEAAESQKQRETMSQYTAALKEEVARLERNDRRAGLNLEYLKNIVVGGSVPLFSAGVFHLWFVCLRAAAVLELFSGSHGTQGVAASTEHVVAAHASGG